MGERRRGRGRWLLAVFAIGAVAAAVLHPFWLPALGGMLVRSEPPRKADLLLVLAGDGLGNRVLKGADLVRQGYAPKALVSSPTDIFGVPEGALAIQYAVRRGFDASTLDVASNRGKSTREEAAELLREARRRGARSLLIVTSDFHTRRTAGIYDDLRGELEVHVVEADDPNFDPSSWWKTREGRKIWLLEFTKLVTGAFGI